MYYHQAFVLQPVTDGHLSFPRSLATALLATFREVRLIFFCVIPLRTANVSSNGGGSVKVVTEQNIIRN
jgi:hypothetical protein